MIQRRVSYDPGLRPGQPGFLVHVQPKGAGGFGRASWRLLPDPVVDTRTGKVVLWGMVNHKDKITNSRGLARVASVNPTQVWVYELTNVDDEDVALKELKVARP